MSEHVYKMFTRAFEILYPTSYFDAHLCIVTSSKRHKPNWRAVQGFRRLGLALFMPRPQGLKAQENKDSVPGGAGERKKSCKPEAGFIILPLSPLDSIEVAGPARFIEILMMKRAGRPDGKDAND